MGAARLGQAASDAVIVTVHSSLTWADAVTWPVDARRTELWSWISSVRQPAVNQRCSDGLTAAHPARYTEVLDRRGNRWDRRRSEDRRQSTVGCQAVSWRSCRLGLAVA